MWRNKDVVGRTIVDNARIYLQEWTSMTHDLKVKNIAEHGNNTKWEKPLPG